MHAGWSPRMQSGCRACGVSWNGVRRSCVDASREESPLSLREMHLLRGKGAASFSRLRCASEDGSLPAGSVGMGAHLKDAMTVRAAAFMDVGCFVVRRAPEVAELSTSRAKVETGAGVVDLRAKRQKNDQFVLGQSPHFLAAESWGEARPARLPVIERRDAP